MAEQLLDRAQVRPALEQVGGEGVAQGVRRDAAGERRLAHPARRGAGARRRARAGGRAGRRTARSRRRSSSSAGRAPVRGSARARAGPARRSGRGASCRPCRGPARARSRSRGRSTSRFTISSAAQAAGVGELEHRAVADLERVARRDPLEQRPHLVGAEHPRQRRLALRGRQQLGGVLRRLSPVRTR